MTMLNKSPIQARFLSNSNGNDCPLPVALLPNGVPRGQKNVTLTSTSSGDKYDSRSLHGVLEHIIGDIFHNSIIWTESLRKVKDDLRQSSVRVLGIGSNLTEALFQQLVQMEIAVKEDLQSAEEAGHSAHEGSRSVAIVGRAGRFPGGHNLEEFWETIHKGCDMHTKVSN